MWDKLDYYKERKSSDIKVRLNQLYVFTTDRPVFSQTQNYFLKM